MRTDKLKALPQSTYVTDEFGQAWQKRDDDRWHSRATWRTNEEMARQTHQILVVATPSGAGREAAVI